MSWWSQATVHWLNQCWPWSNSPYGVTMSHRVNTLRSKQKGRYFAGDICKHIFLTDNIRVLSPKSLVDNTSSLVQLMACRLFSETPLNELIIQPTGADGLGLNELTIWQWWFNFDGKSTLLSSKIKSTDRYKILPMNWKSCCLVLDKIL